MFQRLQMKNRRFVEVCAERRVETVGGLDLGADVIIPFFSVVTDDGEAN